MSQIIPILNHEEGYREKPYIDTEGYPTVGIGIKIGPKGAALKYYTFTVPRAVGDLWAQTFVDGVIRECRSNPSIYAAMQKSNPARQDILISMAYQMGVAGLAGFKNTLALIAAGKFTEAASGMLSSKWARQTPNRAQRHAEVMRTGTYDIYKGLI
ncbi:glycoside hydrolase family protein [Pseudescherichia vulneris]|uniref:glycoside hydrolase family protein n=1 Tax=Pseudescherichia vulneris TaxID=566 RepID=UPI00227C8BE0|nr:glycoside hydrolase family protein [Pseudescherichia vulneris]WAH52597.1 glycoside hydrolase family protein [Pseudescherichia vulneris]